MEGKVGSCIARFKKTLHSWFSYDGLNVKLNVRRDINANHSLMRGLQARGA